MASVVFDSRSEQLAVVALFLMIGSFYAGTLFGSNPSSIVVQSPVHLSTSSASPSSSKDHAGGRIFEGCGGSKEQLKYMVMEAFRGGCQGHRAELYASQVVKCLAALEGREKGYVDDLKKAVELVILPRSTVNDNSQDQQNQPPPPPPPQSQDSAEDQNEEEEQEDDDQEDQENEQQEPQIPEEFILMVKVVL